MVELKSLKYNFIKTIVCILVVIGHVIRMYTDQGLLHPCISSDFLGGLSKFIYYFHMPLFFVITGAVYGLCIDDLGKYTDNKKFVKTKFLRLMIPYLCFGLFYVAPIMVLFKFTDLSYWEYCFKFLLLGYGSRHLWFLIALFFIFMFFMLAKKIIAKFHPAINILLFIIMYYASNLLGSVPSNILGNILFFYIGYLINKYFEKIYTFIIKNKISTIFFTLLYIVLFYLSGKIYITNLFISIVGIFMALSLLLIIPEKIYKENKIYKHIKQNSMGIFLFHPIIIYVLFYLFGDKTINPYILSGTIFIISFIVSDFLTTIMKKSKIKFIMGEK